jgi:hypothetical protein
MTEHPLGNSAYMSLTNLLPGLDRFSDRYKKFLDQVPGFPGPGVAAVAEAARVLREIEASTRAGPFIGPAARRQGAERMALGRMPSEGR